MGSPFQNGLLVETIALKSTTQFRLPLDWAFSIKGELDLLSLKTFSLVKWALEHNGLSPFVRPLFPSEWGILPFQTLFGLVFEFEIEKREDEAQLFPIFSLVLTCVPNL